MFHSQFLPVRDKATAIRAAAISRRIRVVGPGWLTAVAWLFFVLAAPQSAFAQTQNTLQDIEFTSLPGNRVQVILTLTDQAPEPLSFTIDNPARIALDLPNTSNGLAQRSRAVGVGVARSVTSAEAKGRTRVVLNLISMVPYETKVEANRVYLTLGAASGQAGGQPAGMTTVSKKESKTGFSISSVDFRRGDRGEGRVVIDLSDPSIPVDLRQQGDEILVDFINTSIPAELERRLDVVDFATPVKSVDTLREGGNVHMVIKALGDYDHLAYQSDNIFTIEVKPATKEEIEAAEQERLGYTGERLSLNFQDIEVRSVLQLLADFTGQNVVVSDTVTGNVTLRLQNVPWDQALEIILKTKGLSMRQSDNVMLVAPTEEIAARERLELESQKQVEELAPLRSEFVQINYAKATDLAELLKSKENSLLSPRGNVAIDQRTNTLLVQDTDEKLTEIRRLIAILDVPVRQVLIESRVVLATDEFSKELGVRFGVTGVQDNDDGGITAITGSADGTDGIVNDALDNLQSTGQPFPVGVPNLNDRLAVDLPASASNAARLALAILGSDYLIDLELSALQAEGRGEIISSPRVITANQKEALIEQGVEIPYQQATSSGATAVAFKKAVLALKVTPQITPDNRIIMDLTVNKDNPDFTRTVLGVPPVDTREVSTQVLVDNGETVVLGGVYEQTKTFALERVPFFGDLPGIGVLFQHKSDVNNKSELLIFVTPKIVKESVSLR